MKNSWLLKEDMQTLVLQKNFRAIMNAFARPSNIYRIERMRRYGLDDAKTDLCQSVLDVFVDHHTYYHIAFAASGPAGNRDEILGQLAVSLSGRQTADIDGADYVVFWNGSSEGALLQMRHGSLEYPDEGATAIYLVEKIYFANEVPLGRGMVAFQAAGPGIAGNKGAFAITGLANDEIDLIRQVNGNFPLGVDVLFVDGEGNAAGLPRSSRILTAG
ncbi:MAG TPA: phosphonate C-P lyase system protein PhnH [Negativicutes bacterium]|nr:phosphonate C-P lyase system protein PhnH [Negativicutes bacterium]